MTKFNQNKQGIQKILIIALLIIAIILIGLVILDISQRKAIGDKQNNYSATKAEKITETASDTADNIEVVQNNNEEKENFKAEVPANIVVPELDTNLSPEQQKEIAVPSIVVPAAPGSESKFRFFKISAEKDAFIPTKIIANAGDTIHIEFTAIDKNYDIMFPGYNMSQSAKAGETKVLEFQALLPGDFTYYCPSCGGPNAGPTGHIIIVP